MMSHDELAEDLAAHLRGNTDRLVWTNIPMGPAGSIRPDVFTLAKSFHITSCVYEVKVSQSDFRSDITSGKWRGYLKYACGVYFAAPKGIIDVKDVPTGCGLILKSDAGWRAVRKPTPQPQPILPPELWVKLLIDGINWEVDRRNVNPRGVASWKVQEEIRKRYGEAVAQALASWDGAENGLRHAQERLVKQTQRVSEDTQALLDNARTVAQQIKDRAQAQVQELAQMLGLDPESSLWVVEQTLRDLRQRITQDGEVRRLQRILDDIQRVLEKHRLPLDLNLPNTDS